MNGVVDTLLNIEIFAFIGLLIWLYLKPDRAPEAGHADRSSEHETDGHSG